jgi:hypothetical protein
LNRPRHLAETSLVVLSLAHVNPGYRHLQSPFKDRCYPNASPLDPDYAIASIASAMP